MPGLASTVPKPGGKERRRHPSGRERPPEVLKSVERGGLRRSRASSVTHPTYQSSSDAAGALSSSPGT